MHFNSGCLYADSSETFLQQPLSAKQQKLLLEQACEGFNILELPGVTCSVIRLGSGKIFKWAGQKALSVEADIGDLPFQGIITLTQFGSACVASCYKMFADDELFAITHSQESRRRAVIDRVGSVTDIDFFFLVDRAVDELMHYVVAGLTPPAE